MTYLGDVDPFTPFKKEHYLEEGLLAILVREGWITESPCYTRGTFLRASQAHPQSFHVEYGPFIHPCTSHVLPCILTVSKSQR